MGHFTAHLEAFGRISPQGGPQSNWEATSDRMAQSLGLYHDVGCDGGCYITGVGYICLLLQEHSRTVHCDQAHNGPVSGGVVEAGVKGGQGVVGAGWIRI